MSDTYSYVYSTETQDLLRNRVIAAALNCAKAKFGGVDSEAVTEEVENSNALLDEAVNEYVEYVNG